jgi:superfamily II RNA helicase
MLRIPSEVPSVITKHTHPLDAFQKQAVYAIQHDENVLVTAKTGSGKTLVGEYQIEHSLSKGKRVFYTTPIKSLTNQKFSDLKAMYPSVGIMTGDIKFCPNADVIVMTTEILRNLLFKRGTATEGLGTTAMLSMDGVDAVVFDEVHYINDPERGKVWEECIMLLPAEINLVMLSATIDSPEMFASWVGELKQRPVHLISTEHRVVPLKHCLPSGEVVMDEKNKFNKEVYSAYIRKLKHEDDEQRKLAEAVRGREKGDEPVEKSVRIQSFIHRMNRCVESLSEKCQLPALFFVFSRRQCEQYAAKIEHSLLTSKESAEVHKIARFHLHRQADIESVAQYHALMGLLEKGVAFHHSGLLPLLKEIVEVLFAKGFVKALFATETFAVGINMPTKTVVFTSYRKVTDGGDMRTLRTHEYIQMAGRAGRRGKDTEGLVLYLPAHRPENVEEVQAMMTGRSQQIESRMDFHYDFIIKCLQSGAAWQDVMKKSYWYASRMAEIEALEQQNEQLELASGVCLDSEEFQVRDSIEENMRSCSQGDRKDWQRKLDTWKNKHFGPRWDKGWSHYKTCKVQQGKIAYNKATIAILRKVEVPFLNNLVAMKFISPDDGKLTQLGVMASEINEGHPLLMSTAYNAGIFKGLQAPEIAALLSCFVQPDPHEYTPSVPFEIATQYSRIQAVHSHLSSIENPQSGPGYWKIDPYWMYPILVWAKGETSLNSICSEYEIYEGNLVKAILKVEGVLNELRVLATYMQDLDMLEALREFTIVRGVVVPNSLYLTL